MARDCRNSNAFIGTCNTGSRKTTGVMFWIGTLVLGLNSVVVGEQAFGRECVCERKLRPICGTDGETYENMCQFECVRRLRPAISVQYSGSCCPPAAECPTHYSPICDNFGSLHDNECHFGYQKCLARKMYGVTLRVATADKCAESTTVNDTRLCEFECDDELDPVCDSRGNSHKNQCFFEQVVCTLELRKMPAISLVSKSRCNNTKPHKSPQPFYFGTPIQEFEKTERSAAEMNDAKVYFQAQTEDPFFNQNPYDLFIPATMDFKTPESSTSSVVISPTTLPAVTSSLSYSEQLASQVALDRATATSSPTPPTTSESTTESECSTEMSCREGWRPVCDSHNRTHRNPCLFEVRVCKLRKMGAIRNIPEIAYPEACALTPRSPGPPPTSPLAREGFCNVCREVENEPQIPICDNTNQTHLSACRFAQWNCEHRANGLEERVLVHVGPCRNNSLLFTMEEEVCPRSCSHTYKAVCDSNGITHPNLCTYQMVNCRERKMKKPDPAWLVYLRECREAENDRDETDEVELTQNAAFPSTPSTSTTTEVNLVNQSERAEKFVCPDPSCPPSEGASVCDNEGMIHKNECMFTWARCVAARSSRTLHLVPDEECPANKCRLVESKVCTNSYDPICASDFGTYPNECFFDKAQCLDKELEVLFKGECQQCLKKPCPIPDPDHEPDSLFFCDQNGETKSKCEFEMIRCIYEIRFGYNITPAHEGKCCPLLDGCSAMAEPICDSRGRIHRNRCHFDVAQCRAVKIEKVEASRILPITNCSSVDKVKRTTSVISESTTTTPAVLSCSQMVNACTNEYNPVCDSAGKTHPNECWFYVRTCNVTPPAKIAYRAVCCDQDACDGNYFPVCDNLNTSHSNLCEFGRRRCLHEKTHGVNLTIQTFGSCRDDSCVKRCPSIYAPICGKNGKTYVNECQLKNLNCLRAQTSAVPIEVDYMGECCRMDKCPAAFEPICDSEHRTHSNVCQLKLEQCSRQKRANETIEFAYNGTCCDPDCSTAAAKPVCDMRGVTHPSNCDFHRSKCVLEKMNPKANLTIDYEGPCCPDVCGDESKPTCDQNGVVYRNNCRFELKQCQLARRDGTKLLETACSPAQVKSTTSSTR